eukprot:8108589-Alexandrium_andersonii.AAC.1
MGLARQPRGRPALPRPLGPEVQHGHFREDAAGRRAAGPALRRYRRAHRTVLVRPRAEDNWCTV